MSKKNQFASTKAQTEQTALADEQTSDQTTDQTQENQVQQDATAQEQVSDQTSVTEQETAVQYQDNEEQSAAAAAELQVKEAAAGAEAKKNSEALAAEQDKLQQANKPAAAPAETKTNAVEVPADIAAEVHEDFAKYLEHFNANSTASTKAWARNVLNTCIKYKRTRPIDNKGCLDCTMFALNTMAQSVQFADEAQVRMRFVAACFKYIKTVFSLELTGRGANQLTPSQFKQYMALSNLFNYWSEYGTGQEISKRMNIGKEFSNTFDAAIAQRVTSIVG